MTAHPDADFCDPAVNSVKVTRRNAVRQCPGRRGNVTSNARLGHERADLLERSGTAFRSDISSHEPEVFQSPGVTRFDTRNVRALGWFAKALPLPRSRYA